MVCTRLRMFEACILFECARLMDGFCWLLCLKKHVSMFAMWCSCFAGQLRARADLKFLVPFMARSMLEENPVALHALQWAGSGLDRLLDQRPLCGARSTRSLTKSTHEGLWGLKSLSMYAIYAYIGVVLGVNVGIYGIHGVSGYRMTKGRWERWGHRTPSDSTNLQCAKGVAGLQCRVWTQIDHPGRS